MKKRLDALVKILSCFIVFLFFNSRIFAKTVTWTGVVSTSWSNAANWSSPEWTGIPAATDNVIIYNTPNQPVLDADVIISSLIIDGKGKPAILKLDGIHSLTVAGDITIVNSGTDKILSSQSIITLTNGGSLSGAGDLDLSENGLLFLNGDLSISGLKADKTTGSKVIFNGRSQKISNGKEYHFNDLDIQCGYTSLLHTNLIIDGNLIGGGTLFGDNNTIQLGGDMMLVSYKPGTSTFELASAELGSASVQHLNANTFYILKNFDQKTILTGRVKIMHQVDFEKGDIILGFHNIYLSEMVKLTRGADRQLSHHISGSKGYFIADGTGSVKQVNHFLFTKKVSPELYLNTATEIGFADN